VNTIFNLLVAPLVKALAATLQNARRCSWICLVFLQNGGSKVAPVFLALRMPRFELVAILVWLSAAQEQLRGKAVPDYTQCGIVGNRRGTFEDLIFSQSLNPQSA